MDIPLVAGTVSTVAFAVSNLPMLRKALRTRDVSSYSLSSMAMINAANAVYSLYVFSLPFGPIWALHTFYVVSCAIMLVLCLRDHLLKERAGRRREPDSARATGARAPLDALTSSRSGRHGRGASAQFTIDGSVLRSSR
jgi:uncharacterized protein with PQ loop repeat